MKKMCNQRHITGPFDENVEMREKYLSFCEKLENEVGDSVRCSLFFHRKFFLPIFERIGYHGKTETH